MQLSVIAPVELQKEFEQRGIPAGVEVQFETTVANAEKDADAWFYLLEEESLAADADTIVEYGKPVFINAVITTLAELPANSCRVNAWAGFVQRCLFEVAARQEMQSYANNILKKLQWNYALVADVPGLVAARIIAMIINEAYFAMEAGVSSKEEIDTAMKLGTNYPFGPFEWAEKIGLQKVYTLLARLSADDKRYTPAETILKKINQ